MNKNVQKVLAVFLSCVVIGGMVSGCKSKEKKESSKQDSTTTSAENTTTSETEGTTASSNEETDASETKKQKLSPDEMLDAFLKYCEDNEVAYDKSASVRNEEGYTRYQTPQNGTLFVIDRYSNEELAKKTVKDVKEYGGWYEEDLVKKSVKTDEDGLDLEGYYCQDPDGMNMLFAIGRKEQLVFQFEAIGDEQVKLVEDILLSMGIDIKSIS
ncbi:MAG: hypothetical protein VZR13_05600 [Saccharofermentanaceae bacterium]|nr:hypothetical protein [Saccharofermentanaceae bacterium]